MSDVSPVSWITAGAVGEPGQRTFFIQAATAGEITTLLVEKEQVDALARHVQALLIRLGEEDVIGEEARAEPAPELEQPLEPSFRVGQMALGFDAETGLILLQCEEYVPPDEDEEEEEEEEEEPDEPEWDIDDLIAGEGVRARFWATRDQMRSLASRSIEIVAQGRPRCRLCGMPIEPEGHRCPANNGHREVGEIR